MPQANHLAVLVGDHSGQPARDVAPDKIPVTIFTEDGTVWNVADLDSRLVAAFSKLARQEGVSLNELLSTALVEQLTHKFGFLL